MELNKDEIYAEYSDGYIVTSHGRVWSNKRSKWLKLFIASRKSNYPEIKINGVKTVRVHRMVAELFIPKIHGREYVNHIDGDKTNNNISNLEWVTFEENMKHAGDAGLLNKSAEWIDKISISNLGKNARITSDDVIKIFKLKKVDNMTNQAIADIVNVSRQYVSAILSRKYRSDVIIPSQYHCG